jgi:predicted neuraminidase
MNRNRSGRIPFFGALIAAFGPMLVALAAAPGVVTDEFVFDTAPFAQCHASTIAETTTGLVAAWFGGTQERNPDVCIWLSRHEGSGWSSPRQVADGVESAAKRYPCWNPVLFQPRNGPLMLFYKAGPSPSEWWGMLITSADGGATWSAPRRLPQNVLGPVKNKPIQLPDGAILCGSSTEQGGWRVHFERTRDLGRMWDLIEPAGNSSKFGAIQPSILFHGGDILQAVGRTDAGRIFESWSRDDGNTWNALTLTELPNPNSGIDAVTLQDGRQLLVYNHAGKDRSPLNVAVSVDGRTWEAALVLENTPGKEFSYPAVIQSRDGYVHVVYTWNRERIKHVVLDPSKLRLKSILNGQWPD